MEIVFLQAFRRRECVAFPHLPLLVALASTIAPIAAQPQKQLARSPRIQSAKSVTSKIRLAWTLWENKALAQLKKWGRFQIVQDRKQADLIFMLSADPYKGGHIITSGGRLALSRTVTSTRDRVPNYNRQVPVRYVFLTVIDPKTATLFGATPIVGRPADGSTLRGNA